MANLFICILTYIKDGDTSPRCKELTGYKCIKSLKSLDSENIILHINSDISEYQKLDIQREIKEMTDVEIPLDNISFGKYSIGGAKNIMLNKVASINKTDKWVMFLDDDDWIYDAELSNDKNIFSNGVEVLKNVSNYMSSIGSLFPVIFPKYKNGNLVPNLKDKDNIQSVFQGEFVCRGYASTLFPMKYLSGCNLRFPEDIKKWDDVVFNVKCLMNYKGGYYLCWNAVYVQNDHQDARNSRDKSDDNSEINAFIRYLFRWDDFNPEIQLIYYNQSLKLMRINKKFLDKLNFNKNAGYELIDTKHILVKFGQAQFSNDKCMLSLIDGAQFYMNMNKPTESNPLVHRITTLEDYMKYHDAWNLYNNSTGELKSIMRDIYYNKKYPDNWSEIQNYKLLILEYVY